MILTDCVHAGNCVIQDCALYKKMLDLLDEESVSGESSGRASLYIQQEVLLRILENVRSIAKVRLKNCLVHKHV